MRRIINLMRLGINRVRRSACVLFVIAIVVSYVVICAVRRQPEQPEHIDSYTSHTYPRSHRSSKIIPKINATGTGKFWLAGPGEGDGVWLRLTGEPKSGTTWLGKVIASLAVELCGSPDNAWCKLGRLQTADYELIGVRYKFEMMNITSGNAQVVALHFEDGGKHVIPGLSSESMCIEHRRQHINSLEPRHPCKYIANREYHREDLAACMNTDPKCLPERLIVDPKISRFVLIFRDPRNVIISERNMRINVFEENPPRIAEFIHDRFKALVAWIFERWLWHTTVLKENTHIVFYEEMQEDHRTFKSLAEFMGLQCSEEEALKVWKSLQSPDPPSDYRTKGLPRNILKFMDDAMLDVLPEVMTRTWGLH